MSSERVSAHFTGAAEGAGRPRRRPGTRRTPRPSGRSRRRPTGRPPAAARARGRASATMAPWSGVRRLVRDPAGEAAVGLAGHGDDAVVLHRHAGQPLADHGDLGDHVGALERRRRPRRSSVAKQTFEPCSGNRSGASGASAVARRRRPPAAGRSRRRPPRRRRRPAPSVSATTAATMSPTKRTALAGEDRPVERRRHHREALERRQAEVVVAGRVDGEHAGHRLRPRDVDRRDRAVGDRASGRRRRGAAPGTARSSMYLPSPVSSVGSSNRTTG